MPLPPIDNDGRPITNDDFAYHTQWQVVGDVTVGPIADANGTPLTHLFGACSGSVTLIDLDLPDGVRPVGKPGICVDLLWSGDGGQTFVSLFAGFLSQRPTIAPGQASAMAYLPQFRSLNYGDFLQAEVVSVGSVTPGSNLNVRLTGRCLDV